MLNLADEDIRQAEARAYPAQYEMNEQSRSLPLSCSEFHQRHYQQLHRGSRTYVLSKLSECLSTALTARCI